MRQRFVKFCPISNIPARVQEHYRVQSGKTLCEISLDLLLLIASMPFPVQGNVFLHWWNDMKRQRLLVKPLKTCGMRIRKDKMACNCCGAISNKMGERCEIKGYKNTHFITSSSVNRCGFYPCQDLRGFTRVAKLIPHVFISNIKYPGVSFSSSGVSD